MRNIIQILLCIIATALNAQDNVVFYRDFDSYPATDEKIGYVMSETGVIGQCASLDGLTSYIQTLGIDMQKLESGFTIEAWVALQEYPWNWSGIFDTYKNEKGIFFGISASGKLGVFLGNGKKRIECISDSSLSHLHWNHVVASIDFKKGITLYINGEKVGYTKIPGNIILQGESFVWIGRSHTDTYPFDTEREVCMQYNSKMILDGLLDELTIYAGVLDSTEVKEKIQNISLTNTKPLEWRKMPTGPKDLPNRFAAYYTRLNYDDKWERLWRVAEHPDVLITFEDSPVRFYFWRGINYGPTWVTENNILLSNQSMEFYTDKTGCNEHMADKQCRYSHVRIIEKNKARILVHWRYALVSVEYAFPLYDTLSNWGDWGDEYFYIYPDGVTTRKQILHSHRFKQTWDARIDNPSTHYQFNETFFFSQPGHSPSEYTHDASLIQATLDGEVKEFYKDFDYWKKGIEPVLENALIKVINTKSVNKNFIVFEPGSSIQTWVWNANFSWNHWPVAQLPSDGRFATANDRPAHSNLSNGAPTWVSDGNKHTAVSLYGMNEMSIENLVVLGNSWNFACDALSSDEKSEYKGYDKYERAFIFENQEANKFNATDITFRATPDRPFYNNALIIKNVPDVSYKIASNNKDVQIRYDVEQTIHSNKLIIWLEHKTTEEFMINITTGN